MYIDSVYWLILKKDGEVFDMKEVAVVGLTKEKAGEMVIDKAISKISEYREKKQWENLFVDTNEFLLKKVERGDEILDEIAEYLSSDEMRQIALNLAKESKYDLTERLRMELEKIMMKYEIPINEADYYISGFMTIIFHELEQTFPNAFQCKYLGDWRKKEEETLEKVRHELSVISNAINGISKKDVSVYTPVQLEAKLYGNTKNPRLDLDFFEIDDEVFREEFEDAIKESNVYIKGQCKEETIYCILNELRRVCPQKLVLVIKSAEDWNRLRKANEENEELGGKIIIPWFYEDKIFSIPNNINIFVFGSEEHPVGKHVIELRKRKRSTIRKKLENKGMDYEEAYKLIEDTHGLYIPMMKKLINGIDTKDPEWLKTDKELIIPLLLCGKWTETDGDTMVVEELCGIDYKQIEKNIQAYINGENPLFVRFREHGRNIIHLASTENAWGYLDDYVDTESELWKKYVALVSSIVAEEDPKYNFPKEQQYFAGVLPGGASCWSMTLKEGLLSGLVMKAYYNNKPQNQRIIDKVVTDILDNVKTTKQWLSLAKLFPILCEASPSAIEKRLDAEWERETGLKEVFTEASKEAFFSSSEYTYYIWGVEQFLCQKEYVAWAIRWLFKMNELRKKYSISNSPNETLRTIFFPSYNITVLSQDEKILLAKEAFNNGCDVWDIFYSELPGIKSSIMISTSKPKYRMVAEPLELTYGDVWKAHAAYLDLCLNNMDFLTTRWEKIINCINHFDLDGINSIVSRLQYEILSMNDVEKITIKEKIREEIYRNRYYNSSDWAMKEAGLEILEKLINEIHTVDPVFEYRYLFKDKYNFPLMNPYPFSEENKREQNNKLIIEEIRRGIEQFKGNGLDIIKLAELCSEYNCSTLGEYMFSAYSDGQFDESLFARMIVNDRVRKTMLAYATTAYQQAKENLQVAYLIAKEHLVSNETMASLLMIESFDSDHQPLIMNESEEIKRLYWKTYRGGLCVSNKETAHFVLNEMLKYSSHMYIIEVLGNCKEYFEAKEIMDIFEKIRNYEVGDDSQLTEYHVKALLSVLQESYLESEECIRVAVIELTYRGLIRVEDMKCLNKCLREAPDLYLQMIAVLFTNDEGESVNAKEVDKQNISSIYSLYHNLKFCPAVEGGYVDADKLINWISELEVGLTKNKQLRLLDMLLGKLFSYSPKGKDGFYPAEEVRIVIENRNSKALENAYVMEVFNSRGVYCSSGGAEERKLALGYKKNADGIRLSSPISAKIYDHLYERYIYEAESERESEEYAGI